MRIIKFLLFLIIILGSCFTLQAQSAGDWENFTSVDGLFKVQTPGPMSHKADTVATKIGSLVYHTYYYQEEVEEGADNFIYMVSFVDYPSTAVHSDSTNLLKDFFAATLDQAAFSIAGKVIYSNPITMKGYPGFIWRINYNQDKGVIKTKAVLVQNRYYSIQAVTIKELALNSAVDRFLDSFRLLHD